MSIMLVMSPSAETSILLSNLGIEQSSKAGATGANGKLSGAGRRSSATGVTKHAYFFVWKRAIKPSETAPQS